MPFRHLDALWHDLECGAYAEDLPLWRALADGAGGAAPCSTSEPARAASKVGAGVLHRAISRPLAR